MKQDYRPDHPHCYENHSNCDDKIVYDNTIVNGTKSLRFLMMKGDGEMPYALSWLIPNRLIVVDVNPYILDEDVSSIDQTMNQWLDTAQQESIPHVHSITNLSNTARLPSIGTIGRGLTFPKHPHFGWNLIVGARHPAVKLAVGIIPQLFKVPVRSENTIEDALDFLQTVDPTLPDVLPYVYAAQLDLDINRLLRSSIGKTEKGH